jgi:hypothetical protein
LTIECVADLSMENNIFFPINESNSIGYGAALTACILYAKQNYSNDIKNKMYQYTLRSEKQ